MKPRYRPIKWHKLPEDIRRRATKRHFHSNEILPRVVNYGGYHHCRATDTWWVLVALS